MAQPAQRYTIPREAARRMVKMIQTGQWKPGQRIPGEQELAAYFGISRPAIREAVTSLSALQILESRHGSGTFVCEQLDPGITVYQLYHWAGGNTEERDRLEARMTLEPQLAFLAAQRATPENLEEIFSCVPECEKTVDIELARKFHMAVARACGNPFLAGLAEILLVQQHSDTFSIGWTDMRIPKIKESYENHREIACRIAEHDTIGAYNAMLAHLQITKQVLNKY